VREWVRGEAQKKKLKVADLRFTQRQVREATRLGHTWVKANMRLLADYEYLEAVGRERQKTYYSLSSDVGITEADLSMIPAPERMASILAGPEKKADKLGELGQ
jgi:hypothetical protein